MANFVSGKVIPPSLFCQDYPLFHLLPLNRNSYIFIALFMYLHYNHVCLLGFLHDIHAQNLYGVSPGSIIFMLASSIFTSQFSWWPRELGPAPDGTLSILFMVWIGIMLHSVTEKLIWHTMCKACTFFINGLVHFLGFITWMLFLDESICYNCAFDWLKSNIIHQILLTIIAQYIFCKVLNKKGFLNAIRDRIFLDEFSTKNVKRGVPLYQSSFSESPAKLSNVKKYTVFKSEQKDSKSCDALNFQDQIVQERQENCSRTDTDNDLDYQQDLYFPYNSVIQTSPINPECYFISDAIPSHPYEDYNSNHRPLYSNSNDSTQVFDIPYCDTFSEPSSCHCDYNWSNISQNHRATDNILSNSTYTANNYELSESPGKRHLQAVQYNIENNADCLCTTRTIECSFCQHHDSDEVQYSPLYLQETNAHDDRKTKCYSELCDAAYAGGECSLSYYSGLYDNVLNKNESHNELSSSSSALIVTAYDYNEYNFPLSYTSRNSSFREKSTQNVLPPSSKIQKIPKPSVVKLYPIDDNAQTTNPKKPELLSKNKCYNKKHRFDKKLPTRR